MFGIQNNIKFGCKNSIGHFSDSGESVLWVSWGIIGLVMHRMESSVRLSVKINRIKFGHDKT